jgi:hypothetical protein
MHAYMQQEVPLAQTFTLLQVRLDPKQREILNKFCKASEKSLNFVVGQLIKQRLSWVQDQLSPHEWQRMIDGELGREDLKEIFRPKAQAPTSEPEIREAAFLEAAHRFEQTKAQIAELVVSVESERARANALASRIPGLSILVSHHDRKLDADDPFDTVSGTLGLTASVDTIALIKRKGASTDIPCTLFIEGRDLIDAVEPSGSIEKHAAGPFWVRPLRSSVRPSATAFWRHCGMRRKGCRSARLSLALPWPAVTPPTS